MIIVSSSSSSFEPYLQSTEEKLEKIDIISRVSNVMKAPNFYLPQILSSLQALSSLHRE